MDRILLRLLAVLLLAAPASAADEALEQLIEARAAAASVFDGNRLSGPSAVVVPVSPRRSAYASLRKEAARAEGTVAPSATPAASGPVPAQGISDGYIGLYPESDFELGTGRCEACRGPREGKWYFLDEVIATPKTGPASLIWIGARELVEGAKISDDGRRVRLQDGTEMPFSLVPQIETNRSYYDASSLEYFRGRRVRIRGEFVTVGGVRTLVARTIWPEDFRLDPARIGAADAATAAEVDALVSADKGGARGPFSAKVLWERPGAGREWEGKPVMGLMLNGAQGDDDEAIGGHFSLFTGRVGPDGSMADWMFDNFYDMDTVSEKGIVAGMVPMDKYMSDLNSGQSWYRPTDMLVLVMKGDRLPLQVQEIFKDRYAKYYAHEIRYDHTFSPCTAQIVDPLRQAGWRYPEQGGTPAFIARLVAKLFGPKGDKENKDFYDLLRQEPTHLFPRAAFNGLGGDVLSLVGAYGSETLGRELSPFEQTLREDLVAVLFVRLPQFPSSRKFGRDAAGGILDYYGRVPSDRSKWQTVPSQPRPYPPPH